MTGLFLTIDEYTCTPEELAVQVSINEVLHNDYIIIESKMNHMDEDHRILR